jgi:predicted acylesterase/phospholipase RssA
MNRKELVLSSGGMKGCMMISCLEELHTYYPLHTFDIITGCSVGSLIGVMVALDFHLEEMKEVFIDLDWNQFFDMKLTNFIEEYGFVDGTKIKNIFTAVFIEKNIPIDITFLQLYQRTGKIITFTTTNITLGKVEYHNIFTTPHLSILFSLRLSINIPLLLKPIEYNQCYYVDGALLNPYPYYVMKNTEKVGIYLTDTNIFRNDQYFQCDSHFDYLFQMITLLWKNQIQQRNRNKKPKNTIYIEDTKYNSVHFEMSKEDKLEMYEYGKTFVLSFLTKIKNKRRKHYLMMKYISLWKYKIKQKKEIYIESK